MGLSTARVEVVDHYDHDEERDPPSKVAIYVDRDQDLVLEVFVDDCVYLTPESARVLATALTVLADEVEALLP